MNIAVDIGNSRLKRGIFFPDGDCEVANLPIPTKIDGDSFLHRLLQWKSSGKVLTIDIHPKPITWRVASTGSFSWNLLKMAILDARPQDKFKTIARKHIPLKIDVDTPDKVGIDRLLAAFAATKKYGDSPMLVVDAGSAITVDVVQNGIFCGGAILPGLTAMSETYPKISEKLPLVPLSSKTEPSYPGKNTEDAIRNGIYWGVIGTIRQFYEMAFLQKDAFLILTGGDSGSLESGLRGFFPRQMKCEDHLVLEGIHRCFAE